MMMKYAHHFHAYQPGDIVYVRDGDGSSPIEYEERRSPVAVRIMEEEIKGQNWTRAMLHSYDRINDVISRLKGVSLDIEPFTFLMLMNHSAKTFNETVEILEEIDAVPTTPFHPIVPHLDEFEQRILARVAFDFYSPFIEGKGTAGFWFPEAVITRSSAEIVEGSTSKRLVFLLDERQLIYDFPQAKYSCNRYSRSFVFGREWELSDAFAFNTLDVDGLTAKTIERADPYKERNEIPYLVFTASDLESLLGNPSQLKRFKEWMEKLEKSGVERISAVEFVRRKLSGKFKKIEGECYFEMPVKEYSSWSDYFDLSVDGKTSDSRWLGYRRADGKVFAKSVKGRRISQIWKVAFTRLFEELNRIIRTGVLSALRDIHENVNPEEFLVRYSRVFFREYYRKFGIDTSRDYVLEPVNGDRKALKLGRVYYLMLLANHSCPRFWENLDTRVTFGNVSVMSKAVTELIRYFGSEGSELQNLFIEAYLRIVNFERLHKVWNLSSLPSIEGWETREEAWWQAIEPEVPMSRYNVVKRAALHVGKRDLKGDLRWILEPYDLKQAVADTGHIPGESHGIWENEEWCEHR
ncbi:glycoside hydrolase [Thermococcus sp.]